MAVDDSKLSKGSFVNNLYEMLQKGTDANASWDPQKCIVIRNPKKFVKDYPKTITGANVDSFCKKMDQWGFTKLGQNEDELIFYSKDFARGDLNNIERGMTKFVPPSLARRTVLDSARKIKEDFFLFEEKLDEVEQTLDTWAEV